MTRLVWVTTIYALVAALAIAAPLSASEEPPAAGAEVAEPAVDQTVPAPAAEAPAAEAPTQPEAPAPVEPSPAPAAQEPPPTEPAPTEPASAEPVPSEPATVSDEAPTKERKIGATARRKRPKARAAASTTVTISDFEFTPPSVTVNVGDTVTWNNDGPTAHSATATDGSFDTGIYGEGESRSHTFDSAGTFNYICTPHPNMKGTVTVQAAATGGGDDGSSGSGAAGTDDGSTSAGATSGSGSDDGPTLPATGLDAGGLMLLGLMTLALGAYLRRRSKAA